MKSPNFTTLTLLQQSLRGAHQRKSSIKSLYRISAEYFFKKEYCLKTIGFYTLILAE